MRVRRLVVFFGAILAVGAGAPRQVARSEEHFQKNFYVPHQTAPRRLAGMGEIGSRDGFITVYPEVSDLGDDVLVGFPALPPTTIAPMFGRLYRRDLERFNWVQEKDMPPGLEWETGSFAIPLQEERRGKKYGRAKIQDEYVYVERIDEDEQGPFAIVRVHYRLGGVSGTPKKLWAGDALNIDGHRNKILRVVPRSFRLDNDLPLEEKYVIIGWVEIDPKPLEK